MPEDDFTYADAIKNLNNNLTRKLTDTFDQIAKIAIRASAELSTITDDPAGPAKKMQRAHSMITLIIDDAMRGLSEATTLTIGFAVMLTLESESDDESGPSPR